MDEKTDNTDVYLGIIEYKRSIGITQWTVLSTFITVSEVVFAFSFGEREPAQNFLMRVFAVMIYWLGFFLYNRYRGLNRHVSNYLVELEQENSFRFQQYLNENFHKSGFSTRRVLLIAGFVYVVMTILVSVI